MIEYSKKTIENEQNARQNELKSAFEEAQTKFANADTFRQALKKYTRIKKLTPNILNELIDRIEVHQAEKTEHGKEQKLVIYYNCIGSIYLPEDSSPPTPDIQLQTRKGVTTSYGGLATI